MSGGALKNQCSILAQKLNRKLNVQFIPSAPLA